MAEGACDVYFEFGCYCWDYAGGAAVLMEAGGSVTDTTGKPWDLFSRRVLGASTPELAKVISENIAVHLQYPNQLGKKK